MFGLDLFGFCIWIGCLLWWVVGLFAWCVVLHFCLFVCFVFGGWFDLVLTLKCVGFDCFGGLVVFLSWVWYYGLAFWMQLIDGWLLVSCVQFGLFVLLFRGLYVQVGCLLWGLVCWFDYMYVYDCGLGLGLFIWVCWVLVIVFYVLWVEFTR